MAYEAYEKYTDHKNDRKNSGSLGETEQSYDSFPSCILLGCSKNEIEKCFGKVFINDEKEVTNSPEMFLSNLEESNHLRLMRAVEETKEMLSEMVFDSSKYLAETNMLNLALILKYETPEGISLIEKVAQLAGDKKETIIRRIKKSAENRKSQFQNIISKQRRDLKKIGFKFNKDGSFTGLNCNIFAKHIAEKYDLLLFNEEDFYEYLYGVWREIKYLSLSTKIRDYLHSLMPNIWTTKIEQEYIEALKREVVHISELNPCRQYINLRNGLLSLETYKLGPHRKDVYSSIQIPLDYSEEADSPNFKEYLYDVFENDEERVLLVQEILGYCLTADTKAQKAFIFLGDGANGKSVLCDVMYYLYGRNNISSLAMRELDNSFARYDLVGKTLNLSTENEIDSRGLNTEYMKAIITGDLIRAEEKYKSGFNFKPICKLVFAANRMPFSKDQSYGFLRRLVVIPFNKTYKVHLSNRDKGDPRIGQADPNLIQRLIGEMGGILNFAIEGLKRIRSNGYHFTQPLSSESVLEEYKEEINIILDFVRKNLIQAGSGHRIQRSSIKSLFDVWCNENQHSGAKSMTTRKFWNEFRKVLDVEGIKYTEIKSNGKDYFTGISLLEVKESEQNDYLKETGNKLRGLKRRAQILEVLNNSEDGE